MAEDSFDLICPESNLDDPGTVAMVTDDKDHQSSTDKTSSFGDGGSESMIALPSLSDEKFALMLQEEKNYLPKDDYLERLRIGDLDMSVRRQALDWILKAHAHYGFGELAFYLSMNYLDRFLSFFELPGGKAWATQLLAVACLSLGAKMAEVNVPLVVDLQVGDPKFVFEAKTIKRMELLVLSNLKWKMNPCTPYSFIDYFLKKIIIIGDRDEDQQPKPPSYEALIGKAVKLILCTIKGIDFLEFKPSEIAAAVAILVAGEAQAVVDVEKALLSCFIQVEKVAVTSVVPTLKKKKIIRLDYLKVKNQILLSCPLALPPLFQLQNWVPDSKFKQHLLYLLCFFFGGENLQVKVFKCHQLLQDLRMMMKAASAAATTSSTPQSPNGVLEAASYLSYKSDERTVGSCPNSSNNSPVTKKKKIDTTTSSSFGTNFTKSHEM